MLTILATIYTLFLTGLCAYFIWWERKEIPQPYVPAAFQVQSPKRQAPSNGGDGWGFEGGISGPGSCDPPQHSRESSASTAKEVKAGSAAARLEAPFDPRYDVGGVNIQPLQDAKRQLFQDLHSALMGNGYNG